MMRRGSFYHIETKIINLRLEIYSTYHSFKCAEFRAQTTIRKRPVRVTRTANNLETINTDKIDTQNKQNRYTVRTCPGNPDKIGQTIRSHMIFPFS